MDLKAPPTDMPVLTCPEAPARQDLPRSIGFWGGSAIMVGIIIGSGIFRTPTTIAGYLGNPYTILLFWFLGGVLSLFGAFTYAELGTMFPRSGGIYVYIAEGLGNILAFIFGWSYMLLVKPLAAGAICMVFAEHLNHLFSQHLSHLVSVQMDVRTVTCVTLLLLTAMNTMGVGIGAGFAILLTGLKTAALAAVVLLALALTQGDAANFVTVPAPVSLLSAIAPAMAAVLWSYDGWSDVASVAGEVRTPQKLLPRIFVVGTAVCIGLYVAVNAVYIWMIGIEPMRSVVTVAPLVMERLVGAWGGLTVTLIILVSTLGATHCSIITGARVTFAQACDGLLFKALARIHPRYKTPDVSLWVQGLLSCAAVILLRDFDSLTKGFVFMMWIFYGAAAVSLIVLRIRRPDLPRPYRCFGYPFIPLSFILSTTGMTILSICESPEQSLLWLATLLAGVPAYFAWQYVQRRKLRGH